MAREIQRLTLKETINVGAFKIEVNSRLKAEAVKYDGGEIKITYTNIETTHSFTTTPIPKEYSKLFWQKAQQQQ